MADPSMVNNMIGASLEGLKVLERRLYNMNSAFTYGKKIKYEDLADPRYVEKLLKYMRKYQSP